MTPISRLLVDTVKDRANTLHLVVTLVSVVINKIFDLAPPLLVAYYIDALTLALAVRSGDLGDAEVAANSLPGWVFGLFAEQLEDGSYVVNETSLAATFAVATIVVHIIESAAEYVGEIEAMRVAQAAQHSLRLRAYCAVQSRESAFMANARLGDVLASLSDDVHQVERFLRESCTEVIRLIVLAVFAAVTLLSVDPLLSALGLAPIPFIIVYSNWFAGRARPRYADVRVANGQLVTKLENNCSGGMKVIQACSAEAVEVKAVTEVSKEYQRTSQRAVAFTAAGTPTIRMFVATGFALVLGFAVPRVMSGDLSLGEAVLFGMLIQRVLWPVTRLGKVFDELARASASAARVYALVDAPSALLSWTADDVQATGVRLTKKRSAVGKSDVVFDKVAFSYGGTPQRPPSAGSGDEEAGEDVDALAEGRTILDGMSFRVATGESLGVCGHSGAGKSTCLSLLLRFADVSGGSIQVGGVDIRTVPVEEHRKRLAYVSQEPFVFNGTLAENVMYGSADLLADRDAPETQRRIKEALDNACLTEFVAQSPDGLDTVLGEKGVKVSMGQRLRISIARAFMKNAPILLLDEYSASIDSITEQVLAENMGRLLEGKTSIVVGHRLATLRGCTRIVVVEGGKVVEEGTHDELVHLGGRYCHMWKVQVGEFEAEAKESAGKKERGTSPKRRRKKNV
jgi:ATP-binding cassette subfamily B protein